MIVRDFAGRVMLSAALVQWNVQSPKMAEGWAAVRGMRLAVEMGMFPLVLETDSSRVAGIFQDEVVEDYFDLGALVVDLRKDILASSLFGCMFTRREGNGMAHQLACLVLREVKSKVWVEVVPQGVEALVLSDMAVL